MRIGIVGGGAAGVFAAAVIGEICPETDVTIFDKGNRLLRKVEISGGGRCNCTNTFEHVKNLKDVYPRGHRLINKLFHTFDYADAYRWFENHGVPLYAQPDGCVFPRSDDSHSIINCLVDNARRAKLSIRTNAEIRDLTDLQDFDKVLITIGGGATRHYEWLSKVATEIIAPVPALYALKIENRSLNSLSGLVIEDVETSVVGTKICTRGDVLITHRGISGPAVLRLTSLAADEFANAKWQKQISINWCGENEESLRKELRQIATHNQNKLIINARPQRFPQRLWQYLTERARILSDKRWTDLTHKDTNRIVNTLTNDNYEISGRDSTNQPIVTRGGVSLTSINTATLQSKTAPKVFFAGEVLDIDGVTGGFNLQAAWTTATIAARSIVGG